MLNTSTIPASVTVTAATRSAKRGIFLRLGRRGPASTTKPPCCRLPRSVVWRGVVREAVESRRSESAEIAENSVTRSLSLPLVLIAFGLITLFLSAGVLVTYFAYDRQASKVEELEVANTKVQMEHVAIGGLIKKRDTKYARDLDRAMAQAEAEYTRGFRAGKRTRKVPRELRALEAYAARGLRVPRSLPAELVRGWRVRKRKDGYALRWAEVSVFASSR